MDFQYNKTTYEKVSKWLFLLNLLFVSLIFNTCNIIEKEIKTIEIPIIETFTEVGIIVNTSFIDSNFPKPWINNGFMATADGMQSPLIGGINTIIEYEQNSHLDSFITLFRFKMIEPSSVILNNYHRTLNLGGHVIKFDMINNTITVYEATLKGVLPASIIIEREIPFDCENGDVVVKYQRDAMIEKYTIVNNRNEFSFSFDTQTVPAYTGGGYDNFGLIFLEGNIIVTEGQYSCQLNAEPDLLILGDSITNGDVNRYEEGGGQNGRWAGIVSQKTSTAIYSLGGNTTSFAFRDRNFYFRLFKPKKIIYALGINDQDFNIYYHNIEAFIKSCELLGIEPILITLQPRSDRVEFCKLASEYVKSRGFKYIDFRRVLTINGNGIDLDPKLFTNDLIHPNVLGNAKMGQEVIDILKL